MQSLEMSFTVRFRCLYRHRRVGSVGLFDARVSNDLERVWEVGLIQYKELWGGTSIRHGAFIRGERLIQTLHLRGGCLLDTRHVFESERLLDHLRYHRVVNYMSKNCIQTRIQTRDKKKNFFGICSGLLEFLGHRF